MKGNVGGKRIELSGRRLIAFDDYLLSDHFPRSISIADLDAENRCTGPAVTLAARHGRGLVFGQPDDLLTTKFKTGVYDWCWIVLPLACCARENCNEVDRHITKIVFGGGFNYCGASCRQQKTGLMICLPTCNPR